VDGTAGRDAALRARIAEHWTASERGDSETGHAIYAADITYDGGPTHSVSLMEFADPFPAPASRAALAEPVPARDR
jgi:hypothetical protein